MKWNAADYAANSVVQQSWARELIAKLNLRGDERILDVGCGDGKVTAEIARAVPRGFVDRHGCLGRNDRVCAEKIFRRKKHPNLRISNLRRPENQQKFSPRRMFDLVFSNAALHWVDDHEKFLRGAASVLKPGGRLIVSCGGKGNAHDVFLALRPEMRLQRWREFFRQMPAPYFFYAPADYEKWLPQYGFKIQDAQARAQGCHLPGARTASRPGCAPPGFLMSNACRKPCAKNLSPPSRGVTSPNIRRTRKTRFMSAWCVWKLMR